MPGATDPVRHEVRIAAPPELVFPYFTDPLRMVEWIGSTALLDPRPGGTFRFSPDGRQVVLGEYVEVAPPHRVVFTWGYENPDMLVAPGESRVEVTLAPDGDGTHVVLTHHDLPVPVHDAHRTGWEHYLARLVPAAEGQPVGPDPWHT